jgi:hypothetical protein
MHPLDVTMVANELGISEYDLFVLAYRAYFTTYPDPKRMQTQFGLWMMGELKLPVYVRYYLDKAFLDA